MPAIPSIAKAWRYPLDENTWDSYRSLELRDVKVALPQSGEVLVKLHAASLNYRDLVISQRKYPPPYSTGPDGQGLIPTSDGAGEIVAVGDSVTEWKVGDRVHSIFYEDWLAGPIKTEYLGSGVGGSTPGCLTQYRTFRAESLLAIPDHLSYEEAATIPCAAVTAWHALFEKKPLTKDSMVLVLGSGGVSVIGAQLAKAAGARVIATTSSKMKEERYKALGVDHVINYREYPEWSEKVREVTGGEGVGHVLEVGGQGTFIQSIKSTEREGWVHIIGFLDQSKSEGTVNDIATMAIFGQVTMSGFSVGSKEMGEKLDAFMAEHKVKPVVDRVFGWNEAIEAFDYQWRGLHFGKVVIRIE